MQKQKTRLTNLILSIFMVLGVFSAFPSLGVNAETFEDYTYTVLEDGTAEITDYTGTDTELEIPAEINGYIVNSIGEDAFLGCSSLTSIIIPEGVTSIGNGAFWDCSSLCSITIPEGVTSIGNSAFMYCSSLTGATIPEGVISIGGSAFENCSSLTSITIPTSVTEIGDSAFIYCSSLISIDVDENNLYYSDIDGVLFDKNISLLIKCPDAKTNEYIIPDNVISIGDNAFRNCSNLMSVIIHDSVTTIDDYAFSMCDNLTSIKVNENNLNYCDINGVLFNKNVTEILCFPAGKQDTSYTIPDSVTSIGKDAFYECSTLTSIMLPDSVTSIGDDVFWGCISLTSIVIPDSVTSIGYYAFWRCAVTIYGYYGSYAETYANGHNIPFVDLNNIPTKLSSTLKKVSPTSAKIYVERTEGNAKGSISYVLLKGDYFDTDFSNMKLADMKNHPDFVKTEYSNYTKNFNFNITNLDRNTVYTVVPFTVKMKYGYFGLGENVTFITGYVSLNTELKTVTADTAKFKISRTGDANGALGYVLLKGDVSDNFKTLEDYQNSENFLANQTSNWTGSVTVTVKGIESGETYTIVPYTQKGGVYSFGLGENITFTAE